MEIPSILTTLQNSGLIFPAKTVRYHNSPLFLTLPDPRPFLCREYFLNLFLGLCLGSESASASVISPSDIVPEVLSLRFFNVRFQLGSFLIPNLKGSAECNHLDEQLKEAEYYLNHQIRGRGRLYHHHCPHQSPDCPRHCHWTHGVWVSCYMGS